MKGCESVQGTGSAGSQKSRAGGTVEDLWRTLVSEKLGDRMSLYSVSVFVEHEFVTGMIKWGID